MLALSDIQQTLEVIHHNNSAKSKLFPEQQLSEGSILKKAGLFLVPPNKMHQMQIHYYMYFFLSVAEL